MKTLLENLYEFITTAQKSRKYNPNTAGGFKTALRLFEKELNDEEKASLQLFKQNFEQIYHQVVNKNMSSSSYTAASLEVYKSRILRLLNDFEKYGLDATKMASWNPKIRIAKREKKIVETEATAKTLTEEPQEQPQNLKIDMAKFELPLREGVFAIIQTPRDLSIEEAKKIRGYIDYLMVTIDPKYKPGE